MNVNFGLSSMKRNEDSVVGHVRISVQFSCRKGRQKSGEGLKHCELPNDFSEDSSCTLIVITRFVITFDILQKVDISLLSLS